MRNGHEKLLLSFDVSPVSSRIKCVRSGFVGFRSMCTEAVIYMILTTTPTKCDIFLWFLVKDASNPRAVDGEVVVAVVVWEAI